MRSAAASGSADGALKISPQRWQSVQEQPAGPGIQRELARASAERAGCHHSTTAWPALR